MESHHKGICISDKPPDNNRNESEKQSMAAIKHKFIIISGKGGVGKSSVSVNLALALANRGYKVGIMDTDIHGPDIPRMLGLQGMMEVAANQKIQPLLFSANLLVVSMESLMKDKDNSIIWRGPMKHSVIRQFIGEVNWGSLDYLIIDAPPGTGDEPLTVAKLIKDAQAVIVTTPQEISLADVRKSIHFCNTIGMKIFGLLENMSSYTCPHCRQTVDLFGTGGGEKTASDYRITFLGKIPFDPGMVKCADQGISFQRKYPDAPVTQGFINIAQKMLELNE